MTNKIDDMVMKLSNDNRVVYLDEEWKPKAFNDNVIYGNLKNYVPDIRTALRMSPDVVVIKLKKDKGERI